jgi:hypothetical protein
MNLLFAVFSSWPSGAAEGLLPPPRRAEWTPQARLGRGLLLTGLLSVPNVALWLGYRDGRPLRALCDHGRPAAARVLHKTWERRPKGGGWYYAQYAFEAGGRNYFFKTCVSREMYDSLAEGGACSVTYLPSRPETHCLGRPEPILRDHNRGWLTGAAVVAALLGIASACLEWSLRRELRLARHGEGVVGRVLACGKTRMKNSLSYWVSYVFAAPDGLRNSTAEVPGDVWCSLVPGTELAVLYDPERPRHHRPLLALTRVRFLPPEDMRA